MRKRKPIIMIIVFIFILGLVILKSTGVFSIMLQLLFNREIFLKKEDHNINLLLLGIGGGAHDGPNLTDTIIFTSIDLEKNRLSLISIPRDLWIPDLKTKINVAYAEGESKKKGGGLILTKAVVSKITGQPIDYALRIDFAGFIKAIDLTGGINVLVERTFDDYEYPLEGKEKDACGHNDEELKSLATASAQLESFPCRYTQIHFNKGLQRMDGETALRFVRSRHALGEEGTDFARSQRQTKVISAFKNKIFSAPFLLNPLKLMSLYSILEKSIDTDIKKDEIDDFIRLAQKMKNAKINSQVLDYGNEGKNRQGLLINPPIEEKYQNQWVLTPRLGDGIFSEIQKYTECEIKEGDCLIKK